MVLLQRADLGSALPAGRDAFGGGDGRRCCCDIGDFVLDGRAADIGAVGRALAAARVFTSRWTWPLLMACTRLGRPTPSLETGVLSMPLALKNR